MDRFRRHDLIYLLASDARVRYGLGDSGMRYACVRFVVVQSSTASYPIELVARSVEGPPIVIRFVDGPSDARPLSILVVQHSRDPYYVPELPTYDIDVEERVEAARETELELPRFALPQEAERGLSQSSGVLVSEEPIPLTVRRDLAAQSAQVAQPALVVTQSQTSRVGAWLGALAAATVVVTLSMFGASQVVATGFSAIARVSSTAR